MTCDRVTLHGRCMDCASPWISTIAILFDFATVELAFDESFTKISLYKHSTAGRREPKIGQLQFAF